MNIGEAAKISRVNAKLIRHYESIGIVPKVRRSDSGYRVYSDEDVHILAFVRRARSLGFSMKEIKKLISLWRNRSRASSDVKTLALQHIQEMEQKVDELQSMIKTLKHLARSCHGDDRPDCPIIDGLAPKKLERYEQRIHLVSELQMYETCGRFKKETQGKELGKSGKGDWHAQDTFT